MQLIQLLLAALLLAGAWWYGRRHFRVTPSPARRHLFLALSMLGFMAVTATWVVMVAGMAEPGWPGVPGVVALVQILRAAALSVATLALLQLVGPHLMEKRRRWVALAIAAWFAGAAGGGAGLVGVFVMVLVLRKVTWPKEIHGWRRLVGLVLSPVIVLALFMIPSVTIQTTGPNIGLSPSATLWPAALFSGPVPPSLELELALIRPFDFVVSLARGLLLAQFILLSVQFLTLPVRLRGVGLRRRITINYLFIRIIPAMLGIVTFILSVWTGFGLHKAAMIRSGFESTIDQEIRAAHRLLDDPDGLLFLEEARRLIGPDGDRSHVLVRTPQGVVASAGTPDSLRLDAVGDTTTWRDNAGLVAVGGALWLRARTLDRADTTRRIDIYVPVDSLHLARLAMQRHVDIRITADPRLFIGPTSVTTGPDTSWTSRSIEVAAAFRERPAKPGILERRLVLSRSFVPTGNWLASAQPRVSGAITLNLAMAATYIVPNRRELVLLVAGNAITLGFLLLLILVVGGTEGMAVRTGRGILDALFEDVSALRDAAQRFGRGELDHRLPVHGQDEIATVARAFNEMAASLKAQQGELVEKKRLEADLALARDIQQRLLPQAPPVVTGVDLAGISIPSLEVGGDLFAFFAEGPNRLGLALGDVSGKSVPAAILMSTTLAALRAESNLAGAAGESLVRLNRILLQQIETGRFVTLVYALLDPITGALEFASAGHNPALLLSATGGVEWLAASGPPLGVLAEATYEPIRRTLVAGDVLVLYSDGITEAARPRAGSSAVRRFDDMEFFDEARLEAAVTRHAGESAAAIMQGILTSVRDFSAAEPQGDDITLLVVKYAGSTAATRLSPSPS